MVALPGVSNASLAVAALAGSSNHATSSSLAGGSGVLFAQSTVGALTTLLGSSGLPLLSYPTDLTRGIVPKLCHSHNDYWRDVPLLDGISFGCESVEADIHLVDGQLLVGHTSDSLSPDRTLQNLYLDPLIEIHKLRNPELESAGGAGATPFYRNWLYDNSRAPFQLLLDFKTDGAELYPHVVDALQPLRDLGLLEYHNETSANPGYASIHARPIRITCTGKCPLELVEAQLPIRDIFFDAPLVDLASGRYNRAVSAMASAYWDEIAGSWGYKRTNRGQGTKLDKFAELSELARAQGMSVRVWDTPSWPHFIRDSVWRDLITTADPSTLVLINADDLEGISRL